MLKDKCFDSGTGHIVQGLPRSIHISAQATTPIARLLQKLGHSKETNVTIGYLLNRIFARGFSAIREIRPPIKELAESLAELRNTHGKEYDNMRSTFRRITGRADILIEQDGNGEEYILIEESGKRYDIKDSASGYYVLTYILSLLHGRPSRLVIIDEPETPPPPSDDIAPAPHSGGEGAQEWNPDRSHHPFTQIRHRPGRSGALIAPS